MLCIKSLSLNPYFNIAAEEYLLRSFTEDIFCVYRNSPSVIVGKHQNAIAEINFVYAQKNGIDVVRRISGGGAVYHDLGNVNFCFIRNGELGALVDFKGFTKPIVEMLSSLGIEAKFEGNNSLTVNGLKVSGNAEHVFKQRVMHHGTLLFSTELSVLASMLYVSEERYSSERAVKSVRSSTVNISDFLTNGFLVEQFADYLFNFIVERSNIATEYSFNQHDNSQIQTLINEKYSKWEWNFGYSPTYSLNRIITLDNQSLEVNLIVEKGVIVIATVKATLKSFDTKELENCLIGLPHSAGSVEESLKKANFNQPLIDQLKKELF
ncbi:MAG: lipoate--protein ligase [Tenuifilaceae bacterium]|nr:lipoate--protein ligase [Tenuifilaceae bacterium]